jgi:MoaA/NifB/PqqE/SkfB family radical SAM enzyme
LNNFPTALSFTVTNACNLKCQMCGQWSGEGYMHSRRDSLKAEMRLADWKRLVDEAADHGVGRILLRGGETFLFPGIIGLIAHIRARGIGLSIDTNGTQLKKYAADLAGIGGIHLTISVDGPERVHDRVRGVKGCFAMIRDGLARLAEEEKKSGNRIGKSANFTISPWSVEGLGEMPEVCRSLGLDTIAIVPYYYFPGEVGARYASELKELGSESYSWAGFRHEASGVDPRVFAEQHAKYLAELKGIRDYPYMPLSEVQYAAWFADPLTPVGPRSCMNVESLVDIQPSGEANFCVDFVDYSMGNVRGSTISEVWNSERAERFRRFRRERPLSVCHRCGAKYMSCGYSDYPRDS